MSELPALPSFPPEFVWGVATASYQIEGAVDEDGRGPSIWDTYTHDQPERIKGADTGDVADDHYHRYAEDIALMRELGVDSYRFSVAWPRVQPDGRGAVNRAGLDWYARLVDALLDAGIFPMITLYHWDLPQPLQDSGGWTSREIAERFADYAALVHGALGDRVPRWVTVNEPYCVSFSSFAEGRHAPGWRAGEPALAAAHHVIVGHGMAVQAMRAQRHGQEEFGITLNLNSITPASDSDADADAARRMECLQNTTFSDPVLAGRYPAAAQECWGELTDFGFRRDGDLAIMSTPLDFLGVNTYFPSYPAAAPYAEPDPSRRPATDIRARMVAPADLPRTSMGWPVEPATMSRLMRWLRDTYRDSTPGLPPIYVTENGASYPDVVRHDGAVPDPDRIAYLGVHLRALAAAMADDEGRGGVDVRGYYLWSLLDNFEWAHGYSQRFGLVHVDYPTQKRTPKASFGWYRDLIAATRAGGQLG